MCDMYGTMLDYGFEKHDSWEKAPMPNPLKNNKTYK